MTRIELEFIGGDEDGMENAGGVSMDMRRMRNKMAEEEDAMPESMACRRWRRRRR